MSFWDTAADIAHEADGAFSAGDWALNHGGQVGLDILGMVPGVGEVASGAQALYHGAHAAHDLAEGNRDEAAAQGIETMWNGVNTIPVVHEVMEPAHGVELAGDTMATMSNWITGRDDPMTGAALSQGAVGLQKKIDGASMYNQLLDDIEAPNADA
jgi:hypothetical protein